VIKNSENSITVVVAGHLCLDLIPGFARNVIHPLSDLFAPGRLINMEETSLASGGVVSNTGIALAKLGIDTVLMGKVGDDPFGKLLEDLVAAKGATSRIIVSAQDSTSYTIVLAPPGYDRILLHNTGANDTFNANDLDYDTIQNSTLFHFGYPPLMKRMYENGGVELTAMLKKVKDRGVTTSLDMALPDPNSPAGMKDWMEILKKVLPFVDIFVPSIEEIMYMVKRETYHELNKKSSGGVFTDHLGIDSLPSIGEMLIDMGTGIVAIKCGVNGLYIKSASEKRLSGMGKAKPADTAHWHNREIHCESFSVHPILSAAGAGDNCIAGFLAAFLRGMKIEDCAKIGCMVGAQNLRVVDAVSGVRDWEETMRQCHSGMERNVLDEETCLWEYDATEKIRYRKDRTV